MQEPYKWEKIDISTHVMPNVTSFHVDIPHFVCMYTKDELKKSDKSGAYYDNYNEMCDWIESGEVDEKYLIGEDRLMPFVFSIREINKLHNAIKSQYGIENRWNVKCLRFYRYDNRWLVTNDCKPIEWEKISNASFIGGNGNPQEILKEEKKS